MAALLRSLRVKQRLLVLRPLYQFLDPIEQTLIGESGPQTLVMRDLAVEFDALVTHSIPPLCEAGRNDVLLSFDYDGGAVLFQCTALFVFTPREAVSGQGRVSDRHRLSINAASSRGRADAMGRNEKQFA
jgi:hypothetical protein